MTLEHSNFLKTIPILGMFPFVFGGWSPADDSMRTHVGVLSQLKKHLVGYVTHGCCFSLSAPPSWGGIITSTCFLVIG